MEDVNFFPIFKWEGKEKKKERREMEGGKARALDKCFQERERDKESEYTHTRT